MSVGLRFLLLALAAARITRLLTLDTIIEMPRLRLKMWLLDLAPDGSRKDRHASYQKLAELLGCPWCLGVYVSVLLVAVASVWMPMPLPWLQMGGVALLVGLIAGRPEYE